MLVYLVRVSLVVANTEVPEGQRHLSYDGRQKIRSVGNTIRLNEEPSFDRFVTSPSPAAVQTAELFAERTDYVGEIEVWPLLATPSPASVIVPQLLARGSTLAVIADEPHLADIGAFLVGRPTFPPAIHAQVSVVQDRTPMWSLRPGEMKRQLLVA